MLLQNYSVARADKLQHMIVPPISVPFKMKILWIQYKDCNMHTKPFSYRFHMHAFYEVHFVLDGECTVLAKSGETCHLKMGDAVLIMPEFSHSTLNSSPDMRRLSMAFMTTDDNALNNVLMEMNFHVFTIVDRIRECLETIFAEVDCMNIYSNYIVRNRIFEIITEILGFTQHDRMTPRLDANMNNITVEVAKRFIAENIESIQSCQDVADYCYVSEAYLNRLFKKYTGSSLLHYIHLVKIDKAQKLLHNDSLTLAEISNSLGFSSEFYFNAFFKRISGTSPGNYRKQLEDENKPDQE